MAMYSNYTATPDGKYFEKSTVWTASRNGDLEEIKRLVSTGEDVNSSRDNFTPLHFAIKNKHTSVAEYLISLPKCNLRARNSNGETALHAACGQNSIYSTLDIVKLLVEKGVNINTATDKGKTGLHTAIVAGQTSVVEYLISLPGCDLQLRSSGGWTPLQLACSNNSNIGIVRLLIKKGVDINMVNDSGSTALHLAIQNTYSPLAEYLISLQECDIHIKDYEGKTALDIAGRKKNLTLATSLRERVSTENSCAAAKEESKGEQDTSKQELDTSKPEQDTSKQEQQSNKELLRENKQLHAFTQCLQEELHQLGRNKETGSDEVNKDGEMEKAPVEIEKPEITTEAQGAIAAVGSTYPGLSDRKLLHIAKELGSDWKTLGGFLGVPHADIQRIHQTYPGETLHCGWCMLIEWRDGHNGDTKSQEEDLKNALQDHGKMDIIKLLL